MKSSNSMLLALGMAACLGLAFSAAVQAQPAADAASEAAPAMPEVKTAAEPSSLPEKEPELPPDLKALAQPELPEEEPSDNAAAPPAADQAQKQAEPPAVPQAAVMTDPAAMPDYDLSLFSHKKHVGQVGLGCIDCHNGIFQQAGGTAKAAGGFNMASFAQGKYCGACHDGGTAFSVKDQANCSRCHGSDMQPPKEPVVFKKPVEAVVFDHVRHNQEFGLACADCHEGLFKMKRGSSEEQADFTMQAMYDGKYCGACHNGAAAFAANTRCTKCHIGVKGNNRLSDGAKDAGHGKGH